MDDCNAQHQWDEPDAENSLNFTQKVEASRLEANWIFSLVIATRVVLRQFRLLVLEFMRQLNKGTSRKGMHDRAKE